MFLNNICAGIVAYLGKDNAVPFLVGGLRLSIKGMIVLRSILYTEEI